MNNEPKLNKMRGISIILCCYNSAERLPTTLKHIAKQKVNKGIQWELVIVNNNSSDNTVEVAKREWVSYGNTIGFAIVEQPIPGLSFAREKGIETSKFEYVLFCDDDNWLSNTYVQDAFEIMEDHPEIGALGGWSEAAYEIEKPGWFDSFANNYAVGKQGEISGDITKKKGCLYGAGMIIRKSQWLELKEKGFKSLLSDRKGTNLSSGGDTEYSYAVRLLGYKIWYDERLYFKHFMTSERLNLFYLKRLRKAMSGSTFVLTAYKDELKGVSYKKRDYINRLLKETKNHLPTALINSFSADIAVKENAKSSLNSIKWKVKGMNSYFDSRKTIQAWCNNN